MRSDTPTGATRTRCLDTRVLRNCEGGAQTIVNKMRVRSRLNERRVGELLRGMDPVSLGNSWVSVTAGLLGCIGDIASLNFMPVFDSTGASFQTIVSLTSSYCSSYALWLS